ncbi:MAG: LysM peptidoglycan-binding domain-containing protein [Lachnospiraceae bacterium]|nr:LysM peptidoglycan-binding domain-containing protein [Lachnospiraceae bacterium]
MKRKMTKRQRTLQIYFRLLTTATAALLVAIIVALSATVAMTASNVASADIVQPEVETLRVKVYTQYEIQRGDTLISICRENITPEYDSVLDYAEEIIYINDLSDANKIKSGDILIIPTYIESQESNS